MARVFIAALFLLTPFVLGYTVGWYNGQRTTDERKIGYRKYRQLVIDLRKLAWANRDVSPELAVQIEDTITTRERDENLS